MRILVPALLSALFLAGCALPPVITLASLAANGASYATTGKGTTDHAISAVVGEDCALIRIVRDEPFCDPDGEVSVVLVGAKTADQNWDFDPETGSQAFNGVTLPGSANAFEAAVDPVLSQPPRDIEDTAAAPTPAPAEKRKNPTPVANLIALAAEPTPRGIFANARPTPKPEAPDLQEPQAPDQPARWYTRLTQKTRGILASPPHNKVRLLR
jgi:hypothetical protein